VLVPALESGFRGRPRRLSPGERVHRSALERFVGRPDYRPATLVEAGLTLGEAQRFVTTADQYWIVPERTPA
jgi:predicted transcriptional regulator